MKLEQLQREDHFRRNGSPSYHNVINVVFFLWRFRAQLISPQPIEPNPRLGSWPVQKINIVNRIVPQFRSIISICVGSFHHQSPHILCCIYICCVFIHTFIEYGPA